MERSVPRGSSRRRSLVAVAALAAALAAGAPGATRARAAATPDTTLEVSGLIHPVRIVTDRFGIPHLEARDLADLYFAWGWVTARDRLWQLERTRRSAAGDLWSWLGNGALRADGGAQLFEFERRASEAWNRDRANPAVRVALQKYADGVNAWIARCERGEAPWPREFATLHRHPDPWRPEDTYLTLYGLGVTLDLSVPEVAEGAEIERHGRGWIAHRRRFESDDLYDTIPDAVASARWGDAGPPPEPATGATGDRAPAGAGGLPDALLAEARRTLAPWAAGTGRDPDRRASNVFAVGPGRSASGRALFANDPHLSLTWPAALHVVHVSVHDTVDAIGAAVPGLPVVVSGRNPECAWGLTALGADVLDVYADTLSRDNRSVRWNGRWAHVREEPYRMRYRLFGLLDLPLVGRKRRYTPHGPVIAWDPKHHLALSLRWSALTRPVTLAGIVGLERAKLARALCDSARRIVTPTLNVVAADAAGGVSYQAVGAVPTRSFEAGYGPLPDDGRHEWTGYIAADRMPTWDVPRRGFVVNANNRPVGPAYPLSWPRFDWAQDRARRIAERLAGDSSLTLADLRSVQNDPVTLRAARLVPRLLACADSLAPGLSPRERGLLDTLRRWDDAARRDRVAPTLYRGWYGAFLRRSKLGRLDGLAAAALEGRAPDALLDPRTGEPERPAVAAVAALRLAIDSLTVLLGNDPARWTWGRAHQARFRHALHGRDPKAYPDLLVPADGANGSPCVGASALPWRTTFTHGPVFRHLVDLAVPNASLAVIPPGNQGGDGPHARDQLERWANHGYVPLTLDPARIEEYAEDRVTLTPAPR